MAEDRYERLKAIFGESGLSRVQKMKIAVVGCGNLGGQLLQHLAMLGVRVIAVVDNQCVERANLSNQAFDVRHLEMPKVLARKEQIARINPQCNVRALPARLEHLGLGTFKDFHLIFCCLDNLRSRVFLNELCLLLAVPWVDAATDGSGRSLYGKVSSYAGSAGAACSVCSWDRDTLATAMRGGKQSCRSWWDWQGENETSLPTLSSSAESAVIAGLQCIQGLKRLLDDRQQGMSTETLVNIDAGFMQTLVLQKNDRCITSHQPLQGEIVAAGKRGELTLGGTFDLAGERLGVRGVELRLFQKSFVSTIQCLACGKETRIGKLDTSLTAGEALCSCGAVLDPTPWSLLDVLDRDEAAPFLDRTWSDLGLPSEDIVTAAVNGKSVPFLIH